MSESTDRILFQNAFHITLLDIFTDYVASNDGNFNSSEYIYNIDKKDILVSESYDLLIPEILFTSCFVLLYKYTTHQNIIIDYLNQEESTNDKLILFKGSPNPEMTFLEYNEALLKFFKYSKGDSYELGEIRGTEISEDILMNRNEGICFLISHDDKEIVCRIRYRADLYSLDTIKRFEKHFRNMIASVIVNPKQKLSEINILDTVEQAIQIEGNSSDMDFPNEQLIQELFESKVRRDPLNVALVFHDKSYSIKEVNIRSNQLARYLRNLGVGRETLVGIAMKRSPDLIIFILAVLKAGGAYLPIGLQNPISRVEKLLSESDTLYFATDDYQKYDSLNWKGKIIDVSKVDTSPYATSNLDSINKADDLAYVIHTSGTTGIPKGVMISHANVVNLLYTYEKTYPVEADDSYLFKSPYTFDASIIELFGWYLGDGKLVILPDNLEKNPQEILKVIQKEKISHINFVPSMLKLFLQSLNKDSSDIRILNLIKYLFVGGEAISFDLVNAFNSLGTSVKFINTYGPTECTMDVTHFPLHNIKCADTKNVLIGKPIYNMKAFILNHDNQLQAIGLPGELVVSGKGVSKGYLNNEAETDRRFKTSSICGSEYRVYHTGDRAIYKSDGNIEFLGRMDSQVKLRGYRIELGEIETVLRQHRSISDSIVKTWDDSYGNTHLIAYYTKSGTIEEHELHRFLSSQLPSYMIPSSFIEIDFFKVNHHGKIDLASLPQPDLHMSNVVLQSYSLNVEEIVCEVIKEVLLIDELNIDDNFFDLGANSLDIVNIVAKISNTIEKKIPLVAMYEYTTCRKLARYLNEENEIVSEVPSKDVDISDIQETIAIFVKD